MPATTAGSSDAVSYPEFGPEELDAWDEDA